MKTALIRIPLYAGAALALSAFVMTSDDAASVAQEARGSQAAEAWRTVQQHASSPDVTISWHAVMAGKR